MKPRTLARHVFPLLLGLSALTLVAWTARDAHAQKDPRAEAKQHYAEGKRLYEAQDYAKAIAEFQAADQLAPSGVNDFNIALAYEQLGDAAHAVQFYQSYLTRTPSAGNRADVESTIARLQEQAAAEEAARKAEADRQAEEARAAEEAAAAAAAADEAARKAAEDAARVNTPATPATPAPTGDPELDRVAGIDVNAIRDQRQGSMPAVAAGPTGPEGGAGAGTAPPPAAPTGPQPQKEPKKAKPLYKQWWFWVVAGVSAYVLISILSSNSNSTAQPGALELPTPDPVAPTAGLSFHF